MRAKAVEVDPVEVGERLRQIRKSHQLNQAQFAEIINVRQSTVSDYENGRLSLSLDQAYLLTQHFKGVTFEWLCTGQKRT